MKIYHYTTIDSLAMILSTQSIKFNRLDKVDDMEECVEPSNIRLWQYIFVSCWTDTDEESIPLWKMYSGCSQGVRIAMDIDMFEDNIVGGNNVPTGIPSEGYLITKIPASDIFRKDYFVIPIGTNIKEGSGDNLFYCHIHYVDDVKAKTKDAYNLTKTDAIHFSSSIAFGEIGKYKNKRWSFQNESRFRILILPINPIMNDQHIFSTLIFHALHDGIPVPISEYYLKLKRDVLDKIEITLHPNSKESDRVVVEALCDKYAKNASIKDSVLRDKVKMK